MKLDLSTFIKCCAGDLRIMDGVEPFTAEDFPKDIKNFYVDEFWIENNFYDKKQKAYLQNIILAYTEEYE